MPAPPRFEDSRHQKYFVIHAQSEDDGEGDDGHDGEYAGRSLTHSEQAAPVSFLKHQNQCPEGRRNGKQVQSNRLHRGEKRSEAAQKRQQRPSHDQRDYRNESIPYNRLIIGIECRYTPNL